MDGLETSCSECLSGRQTLEVCVCACVCVCVCVKSDKSSARRTRITAWSTHLHRP